MISLAAFDMAGTTVNDGGAVYRALEESVQETGVAVSKTDLQTWMGVEKREAIAALISLGGGEPTPERVAAAYERFTALLTEFYLADPPTAIDGVPEAITALQSAGIKVALTTGFSRNVAEGILAGLGWVIAGASSSDDALTQAVRIDALACGDDVAAGRPAPYMIHRVMEATGVFDVAEVLVAGDTAVDVRAGANSGASITIGVLSGKLVREDFAGEPATAVLGSVADIPAHLGL